MSSFQQFKQNGSIPKDSQNYFNENISQKPSQQQQQQPNVRHIPIFVEGRDEPVINKNLDTKPNENSMKTPPSELPKPTSIFDRFPRMSDLNVKKSASNQRCASPNRNIPINVQKTNSMHSDSGIPKNDYQQRQTYTKELPSQQFSQAQPTQKRYYQQQEKEEEEPEEQTIPIQYNEMQQKSPHTQQNQQEPDLQQPSINQQLPLAGAKQDDSINKIQNIQKDVLELMDYVERFMGSRKDKQYMYLDEMLTQNLLKLDTIDAEGKENIKQARREAIKCINKCINVLEAKADAGDNNIQYNNKQLYQSSSSSNNIKNNQSQNDINKKSTYNNLSTIASGKNPSQV